MIAVAIAAVATTCLPVAAAAESSPPFPAATPAAARETLSVEQCVELARHGSPDVQAALSAQAAARHDSVATGFNRRPGYALDTGAIVAPSGFYDPVITNLGEYQLKLGAEWTALDGGRRARARARAALDAAQATPDRARAARHAGTPPATGELPA